MSASNFVVKSESFGGQFSEKLDSDVTLMVEDQKLYVHSAILTMVSPVFKKMLSGEGNTKQRMIKDKKLEDVLLMLKAIYPQFQPSLIGNLKVQELKTLAAFAREYEMMSLTTFVEKQANHLIVEVSQRDGLVSENLKTKSLLMSVLCLAGEENMKELAEKCIEYIAILSKGHMGTTGVIENLSHEDMEVLPDSIRVKLCVRMVKEVMIREPTSPISNFKETIEFLSKVEL